MPMPHRTQMQLIKKRLVGKDDAERISALGVPVVQINTGGACHLDANMISEVLRELPLRELDLLIIENVGNLVCPAEFNVGEDVKMMVLSVAEGHDKPLKYPLMFQQSSALVLNKIDLLPYVNTDLNKVRNDSLSCRSALVSQRRGRPTDNHSSTSASSAAEPLKACSSIEGDQAVVAGQ